MEEFDLFREGYDLRFVLREVPNRRIHVHWKNGSQDNGSSNVLRSQADLVGWFREAYDEMSVPKNIAGLVQESLEFFLVIIRKANLEPIVFRQQEYFIRWAHAACTLHSFVLLQIINHSHQSWL